MNNVQKEKNDEDPVSMGKVFFEARKTEMEELKKNNDAHPYPHKFGISCTVLEYNEKYEHVKNDETLENIVERVAGRILSIRRSSSKLYFFDLQSDGAKLQVKISQQMFDNKEKFAAEMSKYHRGDIIGIEGFPSRTKRGELSIISKSVRFTFVFCKIQ